MKEYIIRGVPLSLQKDAWWLCNVVSQKEAVISKVKNRSQKMINLKSPYKFATLLFILIAIADFLFWEHKIGVSLAYFGIILITTLLLAIKRDFNVKRLSLIAIFTVLSILPILEHVQFLSILYYCMGLISISVWVAFGQHAPFKKVLHGSMRFLTYFPWLTVNELSKNFHVFSEQMSIPKNGNQLLLAWCLPIVADVVFISLFVLSNPIIEVRLLNIANSIGGIYDIQSSPLDTLPESDIICLKKNSSNSHLVNQCLFPAHKCRIYINKLIDDLCFNHHP